MTWRAVELRTPRAEAQMYRKADSTFWLLTIAALAGLFVAFYLV